MNTIVQRSKKYKIDLIYKPYNGHILQVNHIASSQRGARNYRFKSVVFDNKRDRFACSDDKGNVFIFNLHSLEYWKILGYVPCSVLNFSPCDEKLLVLSSNNAPYEALFIVPETGKLKDILEGHKSKVKDCVFSSNHKLIVSVSNMQAYIWESHTKIKYFRLINGQCIRQLSFAPISDNIVISFSNDCLEIWNQETLKQLDIRHHAFHWVKSCAFSTNGRCMVIGTYDTVLAFDTSEWVCIQKVYLSKLNINGAKSVCFVPEPIDGGCNRILAIMSFKYDFHLIDLEKSQVSYTFQSSAYKIACSLNGKYIACVLNSGEINVYNSMLLNQTLRNKKPEQPLVSKRKKIRPYNSLLYSNLTYENDDSVECVKKSLNKEKLHIFLNNFGEYPEKNRSLIWQILLKVPLNREAYCDLISRPVHPKVKNLVKCITLSDRVLLDHFKTVLSCICYWDPLLANLDFLHCLIFPFVKVLHRDPLFCFEAIITVLTNYCQLMESASYDLSMLNMIESIFQQHDPLLLKHFCCVGVSSRVYAENLLKSNFSDIFSPHDWLRLWDHIISNEPAFIYMAVVSYSIVHRSALKKLTKLEQFEEFYSSQKLTNMKYFLSKCYELLNDTQDSTHPRIYLNPFCALEKGMCYGRNNCSA